ncbi:MAG: galactosyltransferase-related protein, partial [Patescibacteria group bacterium]
MFSIVMPLDNGRFEQFRNTKQAYDAMPQKKEFIIPTRSAPDLKDYLKDNKLDKNVLVIPYTIEVGFNCSRALNIGVRNAHFDTIIITCPEVKPITPVLEQLEACKGKNIVCQVWETDIEGNKKWSLVNSRRKNYSPEAYFLAMFNKKDIESINGWDEEFMKGYAFEDCDFGARWVRAGLPFEI